MSEKKESLKKSLALFSYEVPTIHKGTKGYGYSYADLSEIFNVIKPLLKKHKLGFTQLINDGSLDTEVFHIDTGESITSKITIPEGAVLKGMNEFQTLGSAITYLRRYAISSMLGLVTDVDNDAGGEQTKKSAPKKTKANFKFAGYEKALDAVFNGTATADKIINAYQVTDEQTKQLKEAEITFKNNK